MSRFLVTGGAGYIGSHTAKMLSRAGHEVLVYDNLSRGHRDLVKWGHLVQGDIRDTLLLREAMRWFRPQAVIHFAALPMWASPSRTRICITTTMSPARSRSSRR